MPRLLGKKLRCLRLERQLTQRDLAFKLGLASHSHIAKLETDTETASLRLVVRLAHVLNVSTDYLLRDTISVTAGIESPPKSSQEQAPLSIGARLRALRIQHQLSQGELASQLGLASRAYVASLEAEQGKLPSLDLLVRIADRFSVSTDYLLGEAVP